MDSHAFLVRLLTALIPVKGLRKRIRRHLMDRTRARWIESMLPQVRARYAELARACAGKLTGGVRLKVCFLVCDAAMFSAEPVYQRMLADERFEPYVAVVPRVSRGEAFLRATLKRTMDELSARCEDVRCLYDPDAGAAQSLEGEADIVFTSVAYDDQTLERYTALPMSQFALVVQIPYGYGGHLASDLGRLVFLPQLVLSWKLFVPSKQAWEMWTEANPLLRGNMVVGGYPKMDRLVRIPVRTDRPKTVLVCPHHTLARGTGGLELSNFLKYADFFLRLPSEFPDVHFVFRPHPLLFPRLATDAWWGERRTADYRAAMSALPNVEFQQGGDYFDAFVNSDGMVHDCGSFLGEYFYTGHPQCYMLEDESVLERQFTPFGKKMHEHVDHAFCEDDVRRFVRGIAAGEDPRAGARATFARDEVCPFHPAAAAEVIAEVMRCLT